MSNRNEVWARIDEQALSTVRNFFSADLAQTLGELFQNARRAGAGLIEVETDDDGRLTVRDDGEGIADPGTVLAFGESRWNGEVRRREHTAGMGLYSLAGGDAVISSRRAGGRGWRMALTPETFEGRTSATVLDDETAPTPSGTSIRLRPKTLNGRAQWALRDKKPSDTAGWAEVYRETVEEAARYLPVGVTLNGRKLERGDWLEGAVHVAEAEGIRFGVYLRSGNYGLNFHGQRVPWAALPKVVTLGRTVHVAGDVIDAPELELTLPARDRVVANEYSERMFAAARRALLEGLAKLGAVEPVPYAIWAEAREAGIEMAEAPARLMRWTPGWYEGRIAHQWLPDPAGVGDVGTDAMIVEIRDQPETEATLQRAFEGNGMCKRLFRPDPRLVGYGWYDAIERIDGATVTALVDGERLCANNATPKTDANRTDAERIDVVLQVRAGKTRRHVRLRTDAAIRKPDRDACPQYDINEARMVTTAEAAGTLEPGEIVRMLAQAYLRIRDDEADDSDMVEERFEQAGAAYAAGLLVGDEAGLLEAVRNATAELRDLVPADRIAIIEASGSRVDIRIVNAEPDAGVGVASEATPPAGAGAGEEDLEDEDEDE